MKKAIGLLLVSVCLIGLIGCSNNDTIDNPTSSHQETTEEPSEISEVQPICEIQQDVAEGEELMCWADTKEEAEEIAKLYEIELVNYSNCIATFTTDKDLQEVIQLGKDNKWPEIELNHVIYLDDPVEKPISNFDETEH